MISTNYKKIFWTVIILAVLTSISFNSSRYFLFENTYFQSVDTEAKSYVEGGIKRATAAFVLARTFNAIVSVAQESELQLEPGGVGVSIALGQALDPVNDMVERFSWVMLASLTSLGLQEVLIQVTPFVSVQIILALALLSLLIGLWAPSSVRFNFLQLGRVLLFTAIILRFAVPTMSYLNQQVYVAFLETRYSKTYDLIDKNVAQMKTQRLEDSIKLPDEIKTGEETTEDGHWWDQVIQSVNEIKETLKTQVVDRAKKLAAIDEKIDEIGNAASKLVENFIDLTIVFVLSTMVFPLLFLWGILKLGRLIVGVGINDVLPK